MASRRSTPARDHRFANWYRNREERIDTRPEPRDPESPVETQARYEPLDVPPLLPFWLALTLIAFIGAVLLWVTIGYPLADQQQHRGPVKELPPEPRLQSAPALDLLRYEAAKDRELRKGAVPIDVAMRETARQGWGPP